MQYITGIESYECGEKTAVTLGKFDGLHRGHQKLVDKIREYGREGCRSVLCAFDMDRESLLTQDERRAKLEGQIDCLISYPFTTEVRLMEAEDFIRDILVRKLHAAHVVVGTDFSFGYRKRGNPQMLREYAAQYGVIWLHNDFKKQNGYLRSIELAKEHHLYRQNYCGCEFSLRAGEKGALPAESCPKQE